MVYKGRPAPWQAETSARDALFGEGNHGGPEQHKVHTSYDDLTNGQLEAVCVKQHKDTTSVTKRCVGIVNQITEVGKGTLEELEHQGRQLRTIDEDLDEVHGEVKHAKRITRFMRLGCCVQLCFGCCIEPKDYVCPPTKAKAVKAAGNATKQEQSQQPGNRIELAGHPANDHKRKAVLKDGSTLVDIDASGLSRAARKEIADNDAEQRKNLEEVGRGMETIKEMLSHMHQEVNTQVKGIDQLNGRMPEIKGQLVSAQRQAKQIRT